MSHPSLENSGSGMSLYRQVLKEHFDTLAPELKLFHDIQGHARFHGKCRIESASGPGGRLLCWLLRLPRATLAADFDFELTASPGHEIWIRHFPGRSMRSTMRAAAGQIVEQIGPVGFWFSLKTEAGMLAMDLTRLTVLGLSWPRAWTPLVWGNERGDGGALHFDAGARLLGLGVLTAYRGFLVVDTQDAPATVATAVQCGPS